MPKGVRVGARDGRGETRDEEEEKTKREKKRREKKKLRTGPLKGTFSIFMMPAPMRSPASCRERSEARGMLFKPSFLPPTSEWRR